MNLMPQEHSQLLKALYDLKDEVRELREVLIGNAKFEQEGIVVMVKRHEKFISALTSKWSVLVTIVVICWTLFATIHYGAK